MSARKLCLLDDWRKVVDKNPEGMRSAEKYFWQSSDCFHFNS